MTFEDQCPVAILYLRSERLRRHTQRPTSLQVHRKRTYRFQNTTFIIIIAVCLSIRSRKNIPRSLIASRAGHRLIKEQSARTVVVEVDAAAENWEMGEATHVTRVRSRGVAVGAQRQTITTVAYLLGLGLRSSSFFFVSFRFVPLRIPAALYLLLSAAINYQLHLISSVLQHCN